MTDDIVTRLREPNFNSDLDLFCIMKDAADEIERLRAELQHSALKINVMQNIAFAPYGAGSEQIANLTEQLAECQNQYLTLLEKIRQRAQTADTITDL